MPSGVYKRSEKTKQKLRISHLGENNFMFGKKLSEETKKKISEIKKKNPSGIADLNYRKKYPEKFLHFTEEHKRKISSAHKGKHYSLKTEFKKGHYASLEVRKKIGETHRKDKCYFWQGGISYKPYTNDWTKTLKRSIRERDKYTCRICGKEPSTNCHHIDYDKKNCCPDNLITLCRKCHAKTNYNRSYWIDYFKNVGNFITKSKNEVVNKLPTLFFN